MILGGWSGGPEGVGCWKKRIKEIGVRCFAGNDRSLLMARIPLSLFLDGWARCSGVLSLDAQILVFRTDLKQTGIVYQHSRRIDKLLFAPDRYHASYTLRSCKVNEVYVTIIKQMIKLNPL